MKAWERALTALRLTTPLRRDIAGAAVLAAANVLLLLTSALALTEHVGATVRLAAVLVVLESSAVSLRRCAPLLALGVGMTALAAQRLLLPLELIGGVAIFFVIYAAAAYQPRRRALAAIVVAAAFDGAMFAVSDVVGQLEATFPGDGAGPPGLLANLVSGLVIAFAVPGLLGAYVRSRREYLHELEERARRLERDRELGAARAVAEERTRIARELHDVAAHHLSGIVVQAGAAESLLDTDREAARRTLRDLRAQGRETLRSMRFLVGVLRAGDEDDQPQAGLDDLPRLLATVPDPEDVRLETTGEPRARRPAVDLAAYRVVQEALTNVRAHAPGAPTTVHVHHGEASVEIDVVNAAPPGGPARADGDGFGLVGMRERLDLLGGRLEAGPRRVGGWRVHAMLPLHHPDPDGTRPRETP